MSGGGRGRRARTGEEVGEVGDGLDVPEEEVVEDAGGDVEGGEVDEGREGACLRHRRRTRWTQIWRLFSNDASNFPRPDLATLQRSNKNNKPWPPLMGSGCGRSRPCTTQVGNRKVTVVTEAAESGGGSLVQGAIHARGVPGGQNRTTRFGSKMAAIYNDAPAHK